jgi:flagellar biosynthesis chaperone FliJ
MATELKAKMGENEKDIPAWIQDHITNAENFISQASSNYHEYGQNEARIAEDKGPCWKGYQQIGMKDKGGKQVPNCVPNESVNEEVKDWGTIHNVFVKFLKMNTKELEKRVLSKDEDATKKAIKSIISGLTNAQRNLKMESVNEAGGRIPKLYIKIEAVKNKIKALEDERKAKYGGDYAKKVNAETDPKKKTQLAQPIIAITKQIVSYQKNLIKMMDDEEKYYANMGKDDELDPNF